jgi:predicted nucleic acid-binding protein
LQRAYEQALLGTELRLMPISQGILREAAKLRAASSSLRTPDAIHAATAAVTGCGLLVQ